MLEIYCDESEAVVLGKPFLFLACYLAPEENWRGLSDEWEIRVLKDFSLPYFHSAELRNMKSSLYRHLDLAARQRLLSIACEIISSHITAGFGVYMWPDHLKRIARPKERGRWGGPYGMCVAALLGMVSRYLGNTDRINVFIEEGHANTQGALLRVKEYKEGTEPMVWPEMVEGPVKEFPEKSVELEMRKSAMRIGRYAGIKKNESPPTQAADLWAYLAATTMRNDKCIVFSGVLDRLVQGKRYETFSLGPKGLQEMVDLLREAEKEMAANRQNIYEIRGRLHALGIKSHVLPWGIVADKGTVDAFSEKLEKQVREIRQSINE